MIFLPPPPTSSLVNVAWKKELDNVGRRGFAAFKRYFNIDYGGGGKSRSKTPKILGWVNNFVTDSSSRQSVVFFASFSCLVSIFLS